MEKINLSRVIIGGLIAGLVMNISEFLLNAVVLAKEVEAAMQALNRPPADGVAIGKLVMLTFAVEIAAVWFYAAIRPRFGAGPKTAVIAGLGVWAMVYLYSAVVGSVLALFPANVYLIGGVWELFATVIATVAGAAVYKEGESHETIRSLKEEMG